ARPAAAAGGATPMSRTAQRSAARRSQAQLTVWPHLLMPEFMSAVLLTIGLTVMAWFINAPLEEHSNPNRTPNPSKAPWYFLNLQELLLHMHPALAGVIVPTLAIILLIAIPYLDITSDETGVWFSGSRGKRIAWISGIYTTVLTIGLILIDKFFGVRATIEATIPILQTSWLSEIVTQTMVPTAIMFIVAMGLYMLIAHYRPTVREVMIAYFTAFAVAWVLMAIIGSAFRGQGMELYWPWDPGMQRIG
ncbi:MAG: menaquinol-cytochrome C reductase, partial [Chloroflexota bacterium]